jgi:ATP-dependent DNA ligase
MSRRVPTSACWNQKGALCLRDTTIAAGSNHSAAPEPLVKAWREVLEHGYEGLVAKDPASPYVDGRTLKWLKVKQRDYRIGERGWEPKG